MARIEINGTEYQIGFDKAVGQNTARIGAVRHLGLKGPQGGFYSAYVMQDGSISKLISVGR
ncbi:hypothetical protein [Ensifer adhaerens]|uniref:hypothetical protein n=1 Tax=Ensifer adhaerens TaxID=106592 RepID=UPI000DC4A9B0|nr:hypothetical protein [Ensifer adhaerens]RAS13516.1 hypothetical protein DEU52_106114 [Ensifer adhaerens]